MSRRKYWSKQESHYLPTFTRLYVQEGMSVEQIADQKKIPVSKSTLYRWVKKHNLDEDRSSFLGGPEAIAKDLLKTLANITKEIRASRSITPAEAQSISMVTNSMEKLSTKISYRRVALQVLNFLIDYLQESDPSLLRKLSEHLGPIRERVKVMYGG